MNGRSPPYSLGIDFGTTNTVLALADADGPAHLVQFPMPEGELIHSTPDREGDSPRLELWESDRVLTWRVREVGTFALSTDGRSVHYWLEADARHSDAEIMLSGPIMGTAAQIRPLTTPRRSPISSCSQP